MVTALEDVAFWSPVRIDDRRVAVADAAGSVLAVDLLTGAESWRTSVGAQVSGPLVANPSTVVVFDAGGAATALDAGTGKERWSADLPAERAALLGDIVVVRNAATLQALDLRTGRHRWLLAQTGTMDDLQPFGDTVVAATQLGTVVVDEQGTVVQQVPAYERLTVVGDTIVGWGPKNRPSSGTRSGPCGRPSTPRTSTWCDRCRPRWPTGQASSCSAATGPSAAGATSRDGVR